MAGGGGLAQSPLLPAGAALALLGLLVYLGALCAACRRYVLPAHSMCCPPPLCFPSWRWGCSVALGTAQGDPVCVHPELGPLGSAALLLPNLQLQPQHNPAWADPAPLGPPSIPLYPKELVPAGDRDTASQGQLWEGWGCQG